jgi:2-polyprenyl-3-methyl-5-hydroxy-6-metoxy-1,4-benzoquinol methylase
LTETQLLTTSTFQAWLNRQNHLRPLTNSEKLYVIDQQTPDSAYKKSVSETRAALDESSWWYSVRNRVIAQILPQSRKHNLTIDVGGGTGIVSTHLRTLGHECVVVEPSFDSAIAAAQRGILTICGTLTELQLPSRSISHAVCCDVLEHVDCRTEFLAEIHRILAADGSLVLTVPALRGLWSEHDVLERHYLRYSRKSLKAELRSCGFKVVKCRSAFVISLLPILFLQALPFRLFGRSLITSERGLSVGVTRLSKWLTLVESAASRFTPIGSSIIVRATKL